VGRSSISAQGGSRRGIATGEGRDLTLIRELIATRDRLVAVAPEIGPDADPEEPGDQLRRREWLLETIRGFDQLAHAPAAEIGFAPLPYYGAQGNPGRTQTLI
jgi:hypothetical protein